MISQNHKLVNKVPIFKSRIYKWTEAKIRLFNIGDNDELDWTNIDLDFFGQEKTLTRAPYKE